MGVQTEKEAITRMVRRAREEGQTDGFFAKRRWLRYALGLPLDVTTDPQDAGACWPVIMHNVSGGGIGFWSKRRVERGQSLYVREYSEGHGGAWVAARAVHCTLGIQGYLVGAQFEHPGAEEIPPSVSGPVAEQSPSAPPVGFVKSFLPGRSLRTKCAVTSAAATCAGVTLGAWFCHVLRPDDFLVWMIPTATVLTFLLGALIGWTTVGGEIRFLAGLCRAIRGMAKTTRCPVAIPETPSQELGVLRQAFVDLATRWRKQEDDERQQREKLEELNRIKSNILAVVSHDLRTPLTSILLYARMLAEELTTLAETDQRRFLGIISDECVRLNNLVDDLLEVQRLESGRAQWHMETRDLAETIRSCCRVFEAMAVSKSIELRVDCPWSLPPVRADSERISQVVSNLLSNAMKYTQSGGKVNVTAEARGGEILLSVADNGPGIPREHWDRIFERFTQLFHCDRKEVSGVGLGLNIVKKIVEHHGGAVWVDSEVGKGSTFYVSLPIRREGGDRAEQPAEESARPARPRVVVCDADPELAAMMALALRTAGYEVRLAHSGCRLLAVLEETEVEVVVTDVLLPDMDAMELMEALTARPDRPFRLIVHSYASDVRELRRRGAEFFLQRPTSSRELLQAVKLAAQRRDVSGLTILLVGTELKPLNTALSDAGHVPIVAESLEAVGGLVRDYGIDTVIVSEQLLYENWENLSEMGIGANEGIRLVVACESLSRTAHELAQAHGATVMIYGRGKEAELASLLGGTMALAVEEASE